MGTHLRKGCHQPASLHTKLLQHSYKQSIFVPL
jgi:hypothetical protein